MNTFFSLYISLMRSLGSPLQIFGVLNIVRSRALWRWQGIRSSDWQMLNVPDDVTVKQYRWSRRFYYYFFRRYHGEPLIPSIGTSFLSYAIGRGLIPPERRWSKEDPSTEVTLTNVSPQKCIRNMLDKISRLYHSYTALCLTHMK